MSIARVVTGIALATAASAHAGVLSPELQRALASRGTHADTAVIVRFADPLDPRPLATADRRARDNRLLVALKARAARSRAALEPLLAELGAQRIVDLWIVHGIAATLPAPAVRKLAAHPGVARIDPDSYVQHGRAQRMPAPHVPAALAPLPHAAVAPAPERAAPGWNIAAIHAPDVWALGHTGQGVVVALMDTGADPAHPDLRRAWRGSGGWFDPYGEHAVPYDAVGHGTQALGVMLSVAPAARWIAVRLQDADGRSRVSDLHRAFQWLMDPDGDPGTIDAPDVVNASWALAGRAAGQCIAEFSDDIRALRSAGIAVVFAAGNDGPAPGTSNSPGNNAGALAVGAVDRSFAVSRQASRGPSACDGAVFPKLVAPGVNVRTADVSHGGLPSYTIVSGSSLAAPHAAGVLALLAGAFPSASVDELEAALLAGARDLGAAGPDNVTGHGLVDALGAFDVLRRTRRAAANDVAAVAPPSANHGGRSR